MLLTPGFPIDEQDDTCIPPLQLLVKKLSQRKEIKLSVITFHYPHKKENYTWNTIDVYAFGMNNKSYPKRFLYFIQVNKLLNKLHLVSPISVVHSFWLSDTALIGERFAKNNNVEHFVTYMGQDVFRSNKYLRLVKPSNPVVFLSKNQRDLFEENNKPIGHVLIPWGVENTQPNKSKKDIDIVAVGSLIELKNCVLLIQVAQELKTLFPELKISLIGDGPQRELLEAKSKELGVDDLITFHGKLSNKEVVALMERSKVFVHTSKYESFGNVFVEALVNKLPIVSSNVGIAKASVYWKIADTVDEYVKHISYFLNNQMIAELPQEYTIEVTVDAYLNLWKTKSRS